MMDTILEHMASIPDEVPLKPDLICERAGLIIEKPIAFMMYAKMSREEYLQRFDGNRYTLMAEGLFFIKSGGYLNKIISESAENIRLETIEKHQIFHQSALTWLTIILTVATAIQALYAAVILYWEYGWFH